MKIAILPSACEDLRSAYEFYERQAAGIGGSFLDTLYSEIDSMMLYAGIHPLCFGKYHRLLSRHFPFAVHYRVEVDRAIVYAVLDCRRNPAWTRRRLS